MKRSENTLNLRPKGGPSRRCRRPAKRNGGSLGRERGGEIREREAAGRWGLCQRDGK
ncbi:hypothetical protein DPMN_072697 [Dreissena polymorpha]|uniref:Uncharacterized protein n=1 Tax=Dreissena polymorpha TaxID=45954 RepID=A0A9D4HCN7_DREPO|nr:hypothetical protein DPMN_072680 [Dreissena polymorpha]KAH3712935.1 hypothetical protein DPMN_072697 [Dreissena polymorpha]